MSQEFKRVLLVMRVLLVIVIAAVVAIITVQVFGCTVTAGRINAEGRFSEGYTASIAVVPEVLDAAVSRWNPMGTRYKYMESCMEGHNAEACIETAGWIEAHNSERIASPAKKPPQLPPRAPPPEPIASEPAIVIEDDPQ